MIKNDARAVSRRLSCEVQEGVQHEMARLDPPSYTYLARRARKKQRRVTRTPALPPPPLPSPPPSDRTRFSPGGSNAREIAPFSMIYVSLTRRDNEKICRLFMTSAHRLTGSFVFLSSRSSSSPSLAAFFFARTDSSRVSYFLPPPSPSGQYIINVISVFYIASLCVRFEFSLES